MVVQKPRSVLVLDELRTLNDVNDKLRQDIQDDRLAREVVAGTIAGIEAQAMTQAKNEVGEDGKRINTNDTLRDAAVSVIVTKDPYYQEARKLAERLDDDLQTNKRMLEFNAGEWKILMAEVELLVAQITASANAAVMQAIGDV
jgi:hypothetical protein